MPTYRDEAVVLRTHKLGEADRIVTLLTRNRGKARAVAKGVRRTSSRFGARLEPFMVVDIQCYEGRNLDTVTQVETIGPYARAICEDYSLYTAAMAMCETADRLTEEGQPALQQFWLLSGALRALAQRQHDSGLVLDSYLLRAVALAGWAPSFVDCARCGEPGPHSSFSVALGGAVCLPCRPPGSPSPAYPTFALLAALLQGDWQLADASASRDRVQASGIVAAYVQYHLERSVKSLSHLDRASGQAAGGP